MFKFIVIYFAGKAACLRLCRMKRDACMIVVLNGDTSTGCWYYQSPVAGVKVQKEDVYTRSCYMFSKGIVLFFTMNFV